MNVGCPFNVRLINILLSKQSNFSFMFKNDFILIFYYINKIKKDFLLCLILIIKLSIIWILFSQLLLFSSILICFLYMNFFFQQIFLFTITDTSPKMIFYFYAFYISSAHLHSIILPFKWKDYYRVPLTLHQKSPFRRDLQTFFSFAIK